MPDITHTASLTSKVNDGAFGEQRFTTKTSARTGPGLFYGWWIALASALGLFLGPIPIAVFSFGLFLKPLVREFHASRGEISLALTCSTTVLALGLPFVGRLIDRLGPRRVILQSTFAAGVILLSAYFCSARIWQLYLFYLILGLATCGLSPVAYCDVISHWFDRHRGLALSVMMLGLGLGAFIMPAAAQYLIPRFGWRSTFAIVGTATLAITLPVLTIFLKDRPGAMGLMPDGSPVAASSAGAITYSGVSWREAFRDPVFWLLFSAFILVAVSVTACFAHIAAILGDRGATAQAAAMAASLFGAGLLAGRVGSGYFLDRFFAPRVAAVVFGSAAAGIGLLRMTTSPELALASAFFIGLGMGAEVDIMAYLTSRYFGLRSFGAIYGVTFAGFGLAGGAGTYLMGMAFDAMGSYALVLTFFCMATFIAAALMLHLGPYRYQVRRPGEIAPELGMLPSES